MSDRKTRERRPHPRLDEGRARGGVCSIRRPAAMVVCAVGIIVPVAHSLGGYGKATTTALNLAYDGEDPDFLGIYQIGDPFLPPEVRIQPLRSAKMTASRVVRIIEASGLDDHVGAVGFSTDVDWIEPLTDEYTTVRARLRGATAGSGSNLEAGMQAALSELLSTRARNHAGRTMIIVSDGRTDENDALDQAREVAAEGVTIHVIGLGCDVDYDLLRTIATIGGGQALFVDDDLPPGRYRRQLNTMLQNIVVDQVDVGLIQ